MAVSSGVRKHRAWIDVNGTRIPVLSGTVTQNATKKSSTFTAEFPMGYPGAMLLFSELGENDTSVIVQSGSGPTELIEGEIDTVVTDFIAGKISVTGRDKSAKLLSKKSAEKFTNKTNAEVVKELASRVGLDCAMTSSTQAGKYVQIDWSKVTDGMSYAAVIHKIAEMEGARWWVKKNVLYVRSDPDDGVYTVQYSDAVVKASDMMQLRISRNVQAGKTTKVTVSSWNPRSKKVFRGTAVYGGAGGTTEYNYHLPNITQDHAEKHAKSKAKEHAKHELSVVVDCVGDTLIDPSMKLRLRGTMAYDQDYEIDSIIHRFGMSGHRMTINSKAPKSGRSLS